MQCNAPLLIVLLLDRSEYGTVGIHVPEAAGLRGVIARRQYVECMLILDSQVPAFKDSRQLFMLTRKVVWPAPAVYTRHGDILSGLAL